MQPRGTWQHNVWQNRWLMQSNMKSISLSSQLISTATVVGQVLQGHSLDRVLESLASEMRPGVQALSYFAMRYLGTAQFIRNQLLLKAPPLAVVQLLDVAIALLLPDSNQQGENTDVPYYKPYVLVSQAVEAAKQQRTVRPFSALVNGVLRRFIREKPHLLQQVEKNGGMPKWNFPAWWVSQVRADWPLEAEKIGHVAQIPAPMTLRVNARWQTTPQARDALMAQGISASIVGPYALALDKPMHVADIPRFDKGYYSVQCAAAQLAAPLLLNGKWLADRLTGGPLQVLDACCAPGGKTAHLMEIASQDQIQVVAMDSDSQRLEKTQATLDRIGVKAQIRHGDATQNEAFAVTEQFDAILLDAPCSASGIVRRHPDIRWLRRASDIEALELLQQKMLDLLWHKLKPGGRLLYCTCSLFQSEGCGQTKNFKLRHNQAKCLNAPGHILPLNNNDGVELDTVKCQTGYGMAADGFYYALFEK